MQSAPPRGWQKAEDITPIFTQPNGWGISRSVLSTECLKLGLADLDVAILQQGQPRRLTQLASLEVYKSGLNGIYYRSRYGHDLENWAIFEPFDVQVAADAELISEDDPDLLAACAILVL